MVSVDYPADSKGLQEPELVEVDAQIKHSSRKLQNAQKMQEQVGNDAERQQAKLHGLTRDFANARQAADEAAGEPSSGYVAFFCLTFLVCRGP